MSIYSRIEKNNMKEGVLVSLKITLIFTVVFVLINQDFSLLNIMYTLLISSMYSFGLGFAQGLINHGLSKKWSWVKDTNVRVWAGIISTILYTIPAVLFINYLNFIIINKNNPDYFFM